MEGSGGQLTEDSTNEEVIKWFQQSDYKEHTEKFKRATIAKLKGYSKDDFIRIVGDEADGIALFNAIDKMLKKGTPGSCCLLWFVHLKTASREPCT